MPKATPTYKPKRGTFQQHNKKEQWGKGRGGRPWRRLRKRIFERDCYLCQDCGTHVELSGERRGVCDHIKPKSQGGTDTEANLQTLCQRCSDTKTAKESRGTAEPTL